MRPESDGSGSRLWEDAFPWCATEPVTRSIRKAGSWSWKVAPLRGSTFGTGTDVDAVDFRVGVTMTWRSGNTAFKGDTYHISSHIGDEFRDRNPDFERRDYVRDTLVAGITQNLNDAISVYGEIGYAYGIQGGAEPLEFQFGAEYAPPAPPVAEGPRSRPSTVICVKNLTSAKTSTF